MNKSHRILSLSLLMSVTIPLYAADDWADWDGYNPVDQEKITSPGSRPTKSIPLDAVQERKPKKSYAQKYPITMALFKAELTRTTAEQLEQEVAVILAKHMRKNSNEPHHDIACVTISGLLTLKNSFNEQTKDPVEQYIITRVLEKEAQRGLQHSGRNSLDKFTRYTMYMSNNVRFVTCTTEFEELKHVSTFLDEATRQEAPF